MGSAAFLVEACRQLGDALVKAWRHHGGRPTLPDDETEELLAMRIIAQRCLYGVDRNPMAVDLAKLSLWLATLAKDHPFTFVDHAIRCGDSLVGLTRRQIEDFTWHPPTGQRLLFADEVRKRTAAALRERQALLAVGDDYTSPVLKREKLEAADERLDLVRLIGDAAIAAFFAADKDKAREQKRLELADRLGNYLRGDVGQRPTAEVAALRGGKFPVTPFHWEIEYPEVFGRENPGFDAFVGNPPFLGGKRVSTVNGDAFLAWLVTLHSESHGNSDLVAHFFRRAFSLLRDDGAFGLIATNTIVQGDTRTTGLRWICTHHGTIYVARKRYKWPGQAAVVVSVAWVAKGNPPGPFDLDGRTVPVITAYLFHAGGHESPSVLQANAGRSYIGSYVLGMGFTFDDSDPSSAANPIAEMQRLVAKDSRNAERIFPYIGGEEVNDSPRHKHQRYVINFGDMSEAEARRWPDLMRILEERVKPSREGLKRDAYRTRWWQFAEKQTALYVASQGLKRLIVRSRIGNAFAFTFLQSGVVANEKTVVFPSDSHATFSALQSRIHEIWAVFLSSTLKDDLQYTPTQCCGTFPFPAGFETDAALEAAGREYYEFRAALMVRNNEGLTKTYNRFHDPEESSPDIIKLRELHAKMDAAVLTAYGWTDLPTTCEFILDYEDEESAEESVGRKRKKPWRFRWPDEVRDEVLARLLKLNAERAEQEKLSGEAAAAGAPTKQSKTRGKKSASPAQAELLPSPQKELFG